LIHPIPPGTRDVLPDEMRELRAIGVRMREVFAGAGYGEVHTPSLEYEDVLRWGEERAAGARYRTFDEHGAVLALRSDMTIPIARLVATRFRDPTEPLRLFYEGRAWRVVGDATGQQREFLQSGIELIGVLGADAEAEVIALAVEALAAAGLARHRVGLGDGALYRTLLAALEVPLDRHRDLLACLSRRDLAGLAGRVTDLDLAPDARELLIRLPELRGGPEVLDRVDGPAARGALEGLRTLYGALERRGVSDRVILDLGLVRELGYYTGAVYEVYDPAVGFALGGGGRYDELIGRFGDGRPACGLTLDVQRVHIAQAAEERLR